MLANGNPNILRNFHPAAHSHHNSFSGMPNAAGIQYRGFSAGQHGSISGLSKLETNGMPLDLSGGLRTAPPFGGFGAEIGGMNPYLFSHDNSTTINPTFLHRYGQTGSAVDGPGSPFHGMFDALHASNIAMEDPPFDWMEGFDNQMSFANANENAIDDSSPSAMTTDSPAANNELMLDGSTTTMQNMQATTTAMWQHPLAQQYHMANSPAQGDLSMSAFSDMMPAPAGTISPKSLLAQNGQVLEMNFPTPPEMPGLDSSAIGNGYGAAPFTFPTVRNGGASTSSTASHDSSLRQSSITTVSGELVTEHIRNVILAGLSQTSAFGHRHYSQPSMSSPLSDGQNPRTKTFTTANFPTTAELQRYVSAYIKCFHPHMPFLHIPSLNFETPDYTTPLRTVASQIQFGCSTIAGGGSCLILSIAAIGALYEHELPVSKELFECAKRLISSYLEERRKANLTRTQFAPGHPVDNEDTPLWLVQAMMLNVIFGHNCGDKTAADIASTHCAALVSLARGAELTRPPPGFMTNGMNGMHHGTSNNGMGTNGWNSILAEPDDSDWIEWKIMEERKRTLYAVFILSSLLVSAYNHAPALTNSEIRLDLPCDEELWTAENAQAWRSLGGASQADSRSVAFSTALAHLLTAAQRKQMRDNAAGGPQPDLEESELKPSTFGCLVLINALHNYIWETRQRHLGRQWTAQETEQMHAHIEPALRAWQAAWASNPTHSLERPNPFGAGPLSADSIPLLDLAYVRLFVNLGRSKDAFWDRDYDAMANELAKGPESLSGSTPGNDLSRVQSHSSQPGRRESNVGTEAGNDLATQATEQAAENGGSGMSQSTVAQCSRRERHLRKAAFYAADSLSMSDKLGFSVAENTFRELPSQSAMCSFDCAQVLAEWASTVQERVGKYLGIIGEDEMDLMQVPGILLLEDEDRKLFGKIGEIVESAEHKLSNGQGIPAVHEGGYGSKILILAAHMLDKAAVWPITKLMARSLETQAAHMKDRARTSVATRG
jgi:Fungal specific transcription factor domain